MERMRYYRPDHKGISSHVRQAIVECKRFDAIKELSDYTVLSVGSIYRVLKTGTGTFDTYVILAKALGVSLDFLAFGEK